jgi:dihydrofolate reductase
MAEIDVAVMGRSTYDKGLEIGPEAAFPPGIRYYVFTSRPAAAAPANVEFVSGDEAAFAARLRSRPGKDIWLIGGGDLAARFLRKQLIDELTLTVHPRILGAGIPLFAQPSPETPLALVRSRTYSTGLVQSVYRAVPADAVHGA